RRRARCRSARPSGDRGLGGRRGRRSPRLRAYGPGESPPRRGRVPRPLPLRAAPRRQPASTRAGRRRARLRGRRPARTGRAARRARESPERPARARSDAGRGRNARLGVVILGGDLPIEAGRAVRLVVGRAVDVALGLIEAGAEAVAVAVVVGDADATQRALEGAGAVAEAAVAAGEARQTLELLDTAVRRLEFDEGAVCRDRA